jgi:CelD/BcsL family acetyltransferase involved in cellulose biosynthesis
MCSWTWTSTWLRHYADVVGHRFVLAENSGGPCGIALVAEQFARNPLRPPAIAIGTTGEPPGSSVFVERNRLLARPADRVEFAAALMAELYGDGRWQRLRLDGMVPEDAEALLRGTKPTSWQVEESPVADLLAGEGNDVLTALPTSRRQRVRRVLRQMGVLETEWAETAEQALDILDELIVLHEARWRAEGKPGAFASPRFAAFHHDLIGQLAPAGRAGLFRVRRAGETIGCLYGLIDGRRLLFYQGGLRRYEENRLRPGIAAHALFMQACRDRGLAEYDFLAPTARYKRDLTARSETLVWAELERPGARLLAERVARRAKLRLKKSWHTATP